MVRLMFLAGGVTLGLFGTHLSFDQHHEPGGTIATASAVGKAATRGHLVLPGVVEADPARLMKVLPPFAGRVSRVMIQHGERVVLGQPLVMLDAPDRDTAYAAYYHAKAVFQDKLQNLYWQRTLSRTGGGTLSDQLQAEADYQYAASELEHADKLIEHIEVESSRGNGQPTISVSSPISGSVIDLPAAAGALWADRKAPLMTLADLRSVWVTVKVPEQKKALSFKGQKVEVTFVAYPSEIFQGEVLFVSSASDQDRNAAVHIPLANPDIRIKVNMSATVTFYGLENHVRGMSTPNAT